MEDLSREALHLIAVYYEYGNKRKHPDENRGFLTAQKELYARRLIDKGEPDPSWGNRWFLTKTGIAFCKLANPRRLL